MIEELVSEVSAKTGLSQEQAQAAVDSVLGFLKERLPAPLAAGIDSMVSGGTAGEGGIAEAIEGKAMAAIGGLFGSKA